MTVHTLPRMEVLPPNARLVAEIFRGLAVFRKDYDETILQELVARLRRHMPEGDADKVMSDALTMDNEIRFRLPSGLALRETGAGFASPAEKALMTLIGHAEEPDDMLARAAAVELGIENHRVLRKCASLLARSLTQAGIEIEWGAAPAAMQMAACGSPYVDIRF